MTDKGWIEGAPDRDGQAWWGRSETRAPFVFIAGQVFDKGITHHAPYATGEPAPEFKDPLPDRFCWRAADGGTSAAVRDAYTDDDGEEWPYLGIGTEGCNGVQWGEFDRIRAMVQWKDERENQ